ncbi:hypothetical protein OIU77_020023 [Salix suchowensis]|uniref:Uncharacterized protein n=1 Tax=Salix suchowensis TaxID=1278906 RepID=A0ABQ9CI45_9ROSI|nr:hypothetical protein OIU77_020023 [Salix suchowensis]
MAYHFRLDFNLIEGFAVVDTNDTADHFRYYDHVAKVSPHWFWFLTRWSVPFLFKKSQKSFKEAFISILQRLLRTYQEKWSADIA